MIRQIAVVGAGLAGAVAARTLREAGYEGRLLLIGDEPHAPYDRPALSKSVLSGAEATAPAILAPGWYADADVERLSATRVARLHAWERRLSWDGGDVVADRIILAMGARARPLKLAGSHLPGVHLLRSVDDAMGLREALVPGSRLVVIGGGLIGCEVATTASKLGVGVTLLESAHELLGRVLGGELGEVCRRALVRTGVTVHTGVVVEEILGDQAVRGVQLACGAHVPADIALICVGAQPNLDLVRGSAMDTGNGILVDEGGATNLAGVFAAGDVAEWPLRGGGRRVLESYLNSQSQAVAAAHAALDNWNPSRQLPLAWTEIAGRRLQMAGALSGPGELVYRGDPEEGECTAFKVADGRLIGCCSFEAPRDFAAARRMIETQVQVSGDVLRDRDVSLPALARELLEAAR